MDARRDEGRDRSGPEAEGPSRVVVRPGAFEDLSGIVEIYNHYVVRTHATFDLEPFSVASRQEWFAHYAPVGRHRLFVAGEAGRVAGYATSSPWRPKKAYDTSVEVSVYLRPGLNRRGIGRLLYDELFRALEREDVHRALAGIALPNEASIGFHEAFGFRRVAHFTEQGRKFGRWWDVAWYEKPFPAMDPECGEGAQARPPPRTLR